MEILGLIPARGGSKGIPKKNTRLLSGRPLLSYTCRAALASTALSRVIVSTDDPVISHLAKKHGVEVPFLRPKQFAADKTPMLQVVQHALSFLKKTENYKPDVVVLLQPTSPFRTARHIDEAVRLLLKTSADTVVSVVDVPHRFNPLSTMKLSPSGFLKPSRQGRWILRRQDKPVLYARNGPAVLVMRRSVLEKGKLYGDKIRPYQMQEADSLDIDTPHDLALAEFMINRNRRR